MSLSLKHQSYLSAGVLFVALAGFMIVQIYSQTVSFQSQHEVEQHDYLVSDVILPLVDSVDHVNLDIVQVQQWLTDISATRGLDGLNDGFEEAQNYANKFDEDVTRAIALANQAELTRVVSALEGARQVFPAYYEAGQAMAAAYVAGGPVAGNPMMAGFDTAAANMSEALQIALIEVTQVVEDSSQNLAEITVSSERQRHFMVIVLIGMGIVLATVVASVLWFSVYRMSLTISNLSTTMRAIANGDTQQDVLNTERDHEIGDMANAIVEFRDALIDREALTDQVKADQLENTQQKQTLLSHVSEDLNQAMSEVLTGLETAASGLGGSVGILRDTCDQSRTMIHGALDASNKSVESVGSTAVASEELSASIAETQSQADASKDMVRTVAGSAEGANSRMAELSDSAGKIGEVLGFIQGIAEQTNLLALNATIEAARAGEAGKGFAVVAAEVKQLASQTEKATGDINVQIADIQASVTDAVNEVREISNALGELEERAGSISATVSEQRKATQEIAIGNQSASDESVRVAALANELSDNVGQVNQSTDEVAHYSSTVETQVANLRSAIDHFVTRLNEAA